ncbi:transglutaminase family protein [Ruania alba]|uniref:Transglutaminase-like enzyme, putative cysteine protease n=1 Tax=Ruania alba TaxID=648782 RepID=A0A1H5KU59_9MICO|nr:transglutaminase family protein [Ruania alba]SEE68263.1 Transglutaminase-like enzyme, putative cysteine protease [Ruania alba]
MSAKNPHANSTRHYRLTHETTYSYPEVVTSSYGRATLLPRPGGGQQVHTSGLVVDPGPTTLGEHRDFAGNRSGFFHVTTEHDVLRVVSHAVITTNRRRTDAARLPTLAWEEVAQLVRSIHIGAPGTASDNPSTVVSIADSRLPSPMVDTDEAVRDYAAESFAPGRALCDVIMDLTHRIYTDFTYAPGSTSVTSRLPEVLAGRKGVCQDFAHLLIGCVRSMGLAARYVSGYIETQPPPGKPKLRGVDASHAWASVWLPGGGWVQVDPTNDQVVDNRYVTIGWGRDYRDVAPLRGIVFTDGSGSQLNVGVDLWPLEGSAVAGAVAEVEELTTSWRSQGARPEASTEKGT